jgi:hypothetical protein
VEAASQQPEAGSIVHKVAKPLMRTLAWTACAAGVAALALATWRNVDGR